MNHTNDYTCKKTQNDFDNPIRLFNLIIIQTLKVIED